MDDFARADVFYWYDFICPFCYVAQPRNAELRAAGAEVTSIAFEAHPEIPAKGAYKGARVGAMYDALAEEAQAAGLRLRWPERIPNTRMALAASAWASVGARADAGDFVQRVFVAHFADGADIGDPECIAACASSAGINPRAVHEALSDGSAFRLLAEGVLQGRTMSVTGTPSWFGRGRLVSGLRTSAELASLLL